jgi:hypothetical protein
MHNVSEWRPEIGLNQYASTCPQNVHESLVLHQMAQQVRTELNYRVVFKQHCEWYAAIAFEHQRDLAQMQLEPQILQWTPRQNSET